MMDRFLAWVTGVRDWTTVMGALASCVLLAGLARTARHMGLAGESGGGTS